MLVLALADLDVLLRVADIAGARCRPRPCSAPTAPSPRTSSRCARSSGRRRARRTCGACSPARRSSPATATATTASRTPTRCAARRRSTAPRATPSTTPGPIADRELVSFIDNPVVLPDGRVESCGNFHGAPVAAVCRLPGHLDRRRRGDQRAAHRPAARPQPLARPAAVPGARRRRQLGPHDRPVHAGGDGRREPPARRPGQRRHAADERDAGGPRLARAGRRPASCAWRSPTWPASWPSSCVAGSWGVALRRPLTPAAGTGAAADAVLAAAGGPGPDAWLAPRLAAVEQLVTDGSLVAAVPVDLG